jgi:elongation factor Ts
LFQAELWLKKQAKQHGWEQAEKLQHRNTSQGVIAIVQDKHHVILGEINCETDFVAQNKKFLGLAQMMMNAVLNDAKNQKIESEIQRVLYDSDRLKALQATDGMRLDDHTALAIGSISENIILTRALVISVPSSSDILLYGSAHPLETPVTRPLSFGRYGALVAVRWKRGDFVLGSQLCQHVIGRFYFPGMKERWQKCGIAIFCTKNRLRISN